MNFDSNRVTQAHIDNFSEKLSGILNAEIKHGNEIHATSMGCLFEGAIMIQMKRQFRRLYHCLPGIEFRVLNDPHYWKEEYFDTATKHLLICPF